ncbi:MAG: HAD-IB family phosphatase [Chloroflexi bacterium]|nr:HAD-IB family phosphatase [Chloroflexota bacterium]
MSRIRLVAFDLDGTLLRGDTVCEVIARRLGLLERMRALEATVKTRDEIARAREEMVGWYGDRNVAELQEIASQARLSPGAQEACASLIEAGVEITIASLTWDFAVERFARELRVGSWLGTLLRADGDIRHVWAESKAEWLVEKMEAADRSPAEVAAVGDSAGDVPLLNAVGLPVFVGKEAIAGLPERARHMPEADLRDVAELILDESGLHADCYFVGR